MFVRGLRPLLIWQERFLNRQVKWGVLGCAGTARKRFIPALVRSGRSALAGIASRDVSKAQAFQSEFGFARAFASYDDLLAAPDIDAVYVPLPIALHREWVIKCLEAGKHVLCEKPLVPDTDSLARILAASCKYPALHVADGFMYRHHPRWAAARKLLVDGAIGQPTSLALEFCFRNTDPANIRNQRAAGGGALNDAGCYLISASRYLLGAEPGRVVSTSRSDGADGADATTTAMLDFQDCTATLIASLRSQRTQSVKVHGTHGTLEMDTAFDIGHQVASTIRIITDTGQQVIDFPPHDQFRSQIDAFCAAISEPRVSSLDLRDSGANARVLEAIRLSASAGRWVDLPIIVD
jgi:predicted dehydrogenase